MEEQLRTVHTMQQCRETRDSLNKQSVAMISLSAHDERDVWTREILCELILVVKTSTIMV